ncbi:WXG100 family type VII secretion target [Bacillus sp. 166amftsu]|uniref:WXG100 family type VII secretion target n=1 Tax=Bacillus sp. 166amftsu TaxID=1761753 RepID=UPI00089824FC|nr:WXG100 family type VII secretion target [Bacillus sp. 166amftsu]SDZ16935.1 Uncharacterized conserved protein YukE [Bacillus sp. 166amftsu]
MTKIIVTPEKLYQLAKKIQEFAYFIEQTDGHLRSSYAQIQWEVKVRSRIEHEMQQASTVAKNISKQYYELGDKLRQKAEEFEKADREGALSQQKSKGISNLNADNALGLGKLYKTLSGAYYKVIIPGYGSIAKGLKIKPDAVKGKTYLYGQKRPFTGFSDGGKLKKSAGFFLKIVDRQYLGWKKTSGLNGTRYNYDNTKVGKYYSLGNGVKGALKESFDVTSLFKKGKSVEAIKNIMKGKGLFGTLLTVGGTTKEYLSNGKGLLSTEYASALTVDLGRAAVSVAAGAAATAASGALMGATIGSVIPGVGTAVGFLVGLGASYILSSGGVGNFIDNTVKKGVNDFLKGSSAVIKNVGNSISDKVKGIGNSIGKSVISIFS